MNNIVAVQKKVAKSFRKVLENKKIIIGSFSQAIELTKKRLQKTSGGFWKI